MKQENSALKRELARLEPYHASRFHTIGNVSFGGVPMAQIWADLVLWEALLNENTHLRAIMEIGTWQGGFSWWLQSQSMVRGMAFRTFDSVKPDKPIPGFERRDVFADSDYIGSLIKTFSPLILFCDGGNKPRELATFSEYLGKDDLVVVHDWDTEIFGTDVMGYHLEDPPGILEEVYGDFCDELGSMSRVFRRQA